MVTVVPQKLQVTGPAAGVSGAPHLGQSVERATMDMRVSPRARIRAKREPT